MAEKKQVIKPTPQSTSTGGYPPMNAQNRKNQNSGK